MNKKLFVFLLLLLIITAIAVTGYWWNKSPETVVNKSAINIEADTLITEFEKNETNANRKYLDKVLAVTGSITEVDKNQDGKPVLLLGSSAHSLTGVLCTLHEGNLVFTVGERITLKGFCNGYTSVVVVSDCIIQK